MGAAPEQLSVTTALRLPWIQPTLAHCRFRMLRDVAPTSPNVSWEISYTYPDNNEKHLPGAVGRNPRKMAPILKSKKFTFSGFVRAGETSFRLSISDFEETTVKSRLEFANGRGGAGIYVRHVTLRRSYGSGFASILESVFPGLSGVISVTRKFSRSPISCLTWELSDVTRHDSNRGESKEKWIVCTHALAGTFAGQYVSCYSSRLLFTLLYIIPGRIYFFNVAHLANLRHNKKDRWDSGKPRPPTNYFLWHPD